MKRELKTILAALVMIISSIAGCIEEAQDPTPDESDGNDGTDGLNETANQTVDNNTGNNTGNNTDNNTDNNTIQPCDPNYDTNATNLSNGECCSSGGQCASMNCNYDTWTCEEFDDNNTNVSCDDLDADGVCDDVDDCVGVYDECGVCNGDGSSCAVNNTENHLSLSLYNHNNSIFDQYYASMVTSNLSDGVYHRIEWELNLIEGGSETLTDESHIGFTPQGGSNAHSVIWVNNLSIGEYCFSASLFEDPDYANPVDSESGCFSVVNSSFVYPDLIAGTAYTNYTAWMNEGWQLESGNYNNVTGTLQASPLANGTEYTINWYLNKSTDGDQIPDENLESGSYQTGVMHDWNNWVTYFNWPIRGGNSADGLTEGWHCLHADIISNTTWSYLILDSDDACFMISSPADADNDGFNETVDCDDSNASINPNATDIWNGVDDDCDNVVDPFMARVSNASFDLNWETIGWVIKNKSAGYEGHTLYWLGNTYFAYRFLASPDMVFTNGTACSIANMTNSPNIAATLATLGLTSANISISMTKMDLGTDTENVEWSYDPNTYIETRYYDGGKFIFKLDGNEFLNVTIGFTEYLNYSQYFTGVPNPNVTMNGHSDIGQIVNGVANTHPINNPNGTYDLNLWRLAEAFVIDYNGTIDFTFGSQDAIIQQHYNTDETGAVAIGVVSAITNLLTCVSNQQYCENWIAAEFNQFTAIAASED